MPGHAGSATIRHADVVVVGGGIAGCAAAYYLARRGVRVTLVERGEIAGEQSGRNWGFVRQQGRDPFEVPFMVASNRIWRGLEQELGADIEWVQGGNLALAATPERVALFEEWLAIAVQAGLDTRLVSTREIQALLPGMAPEWLAGLYTASDGHAEPVKATQAFAQPRVGAHLHRPRRPCRVGGRGGRVSGVLTEQADCARRLPPGR
jgi:glycine/D-amino acid oxidase-like deaminating enzyme